MTVTQGRELLTVRGIAYEVGEPVERTQESILSLESLKQLVVARRVTRDGNPVMMTTTKEPLILPTSPTQEQIKENSQLKTQYQEAYTDYLRILKQRVEVPVPVIVGQVYTTDNDAYFFLKQMDTDVVSALPYTTEAAPESMLFHLQIAEIVE